MEENEKLYLLDTSVLINRPEVINDYADRAIIPWIVLEELDSLKTEENEKGYRARQALRYILDNIEKIEIGKTPDDEILYNNTLKNDNRILLVAKHNSDRIVLLTCDINLFVKAYYLNVDAKLLNQDNEEDYYKGYVEYNLTNEQVVELYKSQSLNDLYVNQYIIINNLTDGTKSVAKWNGEYLQECKSKGFKSKIVGDFKANDEYQKCVVDSLINNTITMIKGKAGSGKSLMALSYAMSQIEKGKYEKLVVFTNPTTSRNASKLGLYPGTRDEKLLESQIGTMLISKMGDLSQVEKLIENNELLLLPFSDIRGYEAINSIVWFTESQNLDIDLMKLGLQRCGQNTKIIIDGDYTTQVDSSAYEGRKNGMRRVSEVFRGKDFYGEVHLERIYRSEVAKVADLL